MPGVSFVLEGGDAPDKGMLKPNLKHIKKVAFVTTYGGDRWHTMLMGDPPRRIAHEHGMPPVAAIGRDERDLLDVLEIGLEHALVGGIAALEHERHTGH